MSILTSCYNKAKFLPDYIRSIFSQQNYSDFEVIFVDDCSSDNSHDIMKSVGDSRLKLFRSPVRLFCASSYQSALDKVTGDIVAVVDADDALTENAISRIMKAYSVYNYIGYIYTQHIWCDESLTPKKKGLSSAPLRGHSLVDMGAKHFKHCFSHWRTCRTNAAKKADIFPAGLKCAVDKSMGYALERVAYGGFLNEALYLYRYYKSNMSLTEAGQQKVQWKKLLSQYSKQKHTFPITKIKL